MLLKDKFYHIESETPQADGTTAYDVTLLPECEVYRGHFPNKPVAPGVCEIEMVKELTVRQAGRPLRLVTVNLCRFKAVASPTVCPRVTVTLSLTPVEDHRLTATATVTDATTTYMEFKGELTDDDDTE